MKTRYLLVSTLILSTLTLASCGKKDSTASSTLPINSVNDLVGTWKTDCYYEAENTRYAIIETKISALNNFTTNLKYYSSTDSTCSNTPTPQGPITGTFEIGEKIVGSDNIYKWNVTIPSGTSTLDYHSYNIIQKLTATTFKMGLQDADHDGSTEGKRPVQLSDQVFKKQ